MLAKSLQAMTECITGIVAPDERARASGKDYLVSH
jgi:hypothetical protein